MDIEKQGSKSPFILFFIWRKEDVNLLKDIVKKQQSNIQFILLNPLIVGKNKYYLSLFRLNGYAVCSIENSSVIIKTEITCNKVYGFAIAIIEDPTKIINSIKSYLRSNSMDILFNITHVDILEPKIYYRRDKGKEQYDVYNKVLSSFNEYIKILQNKSNKQNILNKLGIDSSMAFYIEGEINTIINCIMRFKDIDNINKEETLRRLKDIIDALPDHVQLVKIDVSMRKEPVIERISKNEVKNGLENYIKNAFGVKIFSESKIIER